MTAPIWYGSRPISYHEEFRKGKVKCRINEVTYIHRERPNGDRELIIEKPGATGKNHVHAVLTKDGNVIYLREFYGRLIADDKI